MRQFFARPTCRGVMLPAFLIGLLPTYQQIGVAATADLAADFGRDVRNLLTGLGYWRTRSNHSNRSDHSNPLRAEFIAPGS